MTTGALSRFTTYCGFALDRNNAQLSSAVAAAGTSLPITNINYVTTDPLLLSWSSYTAIIVDGPSTEAVALTGALSGGAVGCASLTYAHPAFTYVVFQLTASIGPTFYAPLETFEPEDTYEQLYDETNVGSYVVARGAVAGKRESVFSLGGPVFCDLIAYVCGGIFGSEDYTGHSTNYQHAFGTLNTTLSGQTLPIGQPVRYLIYNFDGYNMRVFAGRWSSLTLTLDPKALLKFAAKFMCRASGVVTGYPARTYSAQVVLPTWVGTTSFGPIGSPVNSGLVLNAEITFERIETENIPTVSSNQDPYDNFVGAVQTKGKAELVFQDDTQYNYYVNESQPQVIFTLARGTGATTNTVIIQMSVCNYEKVMMKQQGKAYVTNPIEFQAVGNSTDATTTGTGLSAGQVTVYNETSGASNYT